MSLHDSVCLSALLQNAVSRAMVRILNFQSRRVAAHQSNGFLITVCLSWFRFKQLIVLQFSACALNRNNDRYSMMKRWKPFGYSMVRTLQTVLIFARDSCVQPNGRQSMYTSWYVSHDLFIADFSIIYVNLHWTRSCFKISACDTRYVGHSLFIVQ